MTTQNDKQKIKGLNMKITASSICQFTYRIHNHTSWETVLSDFAESRQEFHDKLTDIYHAAAERAEDHSITSGSLADVISDYGDSIPSELKSAAGPFVAVHWNHSYEVESFATLADAEKQCAEWSYEVGYQAIHFDVGGHSGPTRVIDFQPNISVGWGNLHLKWERCEQADAEDVRAAIEDDCDEETPMPTDAELEQLADAINEELVKFTE